MVRTLSLSWKVGLSLSLSRVDLIATMQHSVLVSKMSERLCPNKNISLDGLDLFSVR